VPATRKPGADIVAPGGGEEIDLVLLHDPAGKEPRLIRLQIRRGGKGLDLSQELGRDSPRGGDEFIVEEVIQRT